MEIEASLPCKVLKTFASLLKTSESGPYVHYGEKVLTTIPLTTNFAGTTQQQGYCGHAYSS